MCIFAILNNIGTIYIFFFIEMLMVTEEVNCDAQQCSSPIYFWYDKKVWNSSLRSSV